ncbi:hypothetical protein EDC96DRAFT_525599 [Choanephora cucurbitarum]|nr:hypothetical protein EDC96DRAFT_525599 [Choanephora cucurbitarum]
MSYICFLTSHMLIPWAQTHVLVILVKAAFYKLDRSKVAIALQLSVIGMVKPLIKLTFSTCCRHSHGESSIITH